MSLEQQLCIEALKLLPHGPEFRFIDKVNHLEAGRTGEGEYRVRGDEPFLKGHFPGMPLFPGVLLLEAGAQLAGIVAQCDPLVPPLKNLKLTSIRNVKIMASVEPGELIQIQGEINGRLGNLIQATVRTFCMGQLLMAGEITLSGDSTE